MYSRAFILAFLAIACLVGTGTATTCFSKQFYTDKLKQVIKDARKARMHPAIVKCFWRNGISFKPAPVDISPTTTVVCYKDDIVIKSLVKILHKCYTQFKGRKMAPSSRSARTGREVVLEGTVRRSCTCTSGCHYCCVMTGIGGYDYCFSLYCGRYRYCY